MNRAKRVCKVVVLLAVVLVGVAGPVAAMKTQDIVTHFWSGDSTPAGTTYLTDSDGAYLTDSDGAYLTL